MNLVSLSVFLSLSLPLPIEVSPTTTQSVFLKVVVHCLFPILGYFIDIF